MPKGIGRLAPMPDKEFSDKAFAIVERECARVTAVRKLIVHSEREWYGLGQVLENPGRASLRVFLDWRENWVEISFMAPAHLAEDGTYPKWPYCEDSHNLFYLSEVLKARSEPYKEFEGGADMQDLDAIEQYLHRAIGVILDSCLPILDGDLSITDEIVANRAPGVWNADGA